MPSTSHDILERFRLGYGKDIDLTLRPAYRELLQKLGDPQKHLPPVFHIAGTNGKGSTCAFLRSMLEAAGYKVHVYTSPHLVRFHERIRVAGKLIAEAELTAILEECERLATPGGVSYFEVSTAAALAAFARYPADFTILETGLGGRLDATNVVEKPLATIITRLSYDHREYLGDTLAQIAGEKAGIMREAVPCFTAQQPDDESRKALKDASEKIRVALISGGEGWKVTPTDSGFQFKDATRALTLPLPALPGEHQIQNAGLAIAALSVLKKPLTEEEIKRGLQNVQWPARLQKLEQGKLAEELPQGWELWLDGGHNDSAGEVLAAQAERWKKADNKPLLIVIGMLTTKKPEEFLRPLLPYITGGGSITIPGEPLSFSADKLADIMRDLGIQYVMPFASLDDAVGMTAIMSSSPMRVLICGSLYLAGHALAENGTQVS
ncbi:MAG TPA: folylpolyglutamate synthase/dihydrofolate synthase family protein [Alphaproteobacteria bacterium]|nr:folylpolyglutamate synthase/dihydrofolate synthase family protein [Alphaproteobacteria bacterium]